jgi:hypothetical protein
VFFPARVPLSAWARTGICQAASLVPTQSVGDGQGFAEIDRVRLRLSARFGWRFLKVSFNQLDQRVERLFGVGTDRHQFERRSLFRGKHQ